MKNKVFVNRTLNLKKVKYIGFDMDHTLVRYHSARFEEMSFFAIIEKLIEKRGYPLKTRELKFDFRLGVRGLVLDRIRGNLLKINRHGSIRASFHGSKPIDFRTHSGIYTNKYIDLGDSGYRAIDTAFAISLAALFAKLVDAKDENPEDFPEYIQIENDVHQSLDEVHRDGELKRVVSQRLDDFIIKDEKTVEGLEKFVGQGKRLFVLTNSDFYYTKSLLDWTINPFLKHHESWHDLFEYVITGARKPRFFYDDSPFLMVDPSTGLMRNAGEKLDPGIYQGGGAEALTRYLGILGDEVLYVGDHIYGDILRLKKSCNWRTAMVVEELEEEMESNTRASGLRSEIEGLMRQKEPLELELNDLVGQGKSPQREQLISQVQQIDHKIGQLIEKERTYYNPHWGPIMRAGSEESYFAHQVDRYSCIYMPALVDLLNISSRSYLRAYRRPLAHEVSN